MKLLLIGLLFSVVLISSFAKNVVKRGKLNFAGDLEGLKRFS